jgi:uncharacterized OB-fold protein
MNCKENLISQIKTAFAEDESQVAKVNEQKNNFSSNTYGWICPKCGSVMSPYTSFCPNCTQRDFEITC